MGRQWETRGDKGRQDLGKADTESNTGTRVRDNGRQWETRGDKTSGRRTQNPTQAHMWGDNGRQVETRGDRGRQDPGKADTPSNTGTHVGRLWETRGDKTSGRRTQNPTRTHVGRLWETMGDKGRQDLGKADTPSNTKADTLRKH